ncbi:MAG: beta-propeller repeat protein [Rhodoglobus sp.]|nr:beta-propeller repeat protein [Rhodoglobus sp.]
MPSRTIGASALVTVILASALGLGVASPVAAAPGDWEVADRVSLGAGSAPAGVAVDQSTGTVYVSDELAGTVSIIDGDTLAVLNTVTLPLGSTAVWLDVDQSTGIVYVVDPSNNVIHSFDPDAPDVDASIVTSANLGAGLGMLDVVEGIGVLVTQPAAGNVMFLGSDLSSPSVILSGLALPIDIAVVQGALPADGLVLVTAAAASLVIYSFAGGIDGAIPVGSGPTGLALNNASTYLAVANSGDNTVSVISMDNGLVENTIAVGGGPLTVAFATNDTTMFTANTGDGTISVIPALTGTTSYAVPVGGLPYTVAFGNAANRLYVPLSDTGELVVLELTAMPTPPVAPAALLPETGGSLDWWPLVSAGLLLVGATLLAMRRRAAASLAG